MSSIVLVTLVLLALAGLDCRVAARRDRGQAGLAWCLYIAGLVGCLLAPSAGAFAVFLLVGVVRHLIAARWQPRAVVIIATFAAGVFTLLTLGPPGLAAMPPEEAARALVGSPWIVAAVVLGLAGEGLFPFHGLHPHAAGQSRLLPDGGLLLLVALASNGAGVPSALRTGMTVLGIGMMLYFALLALSDPRLPRQALGVSQIHRGLIVAAAFTAATDSAILAAYALGATASVALFGMIVSSVQRRTGLTTLVADRLGLAESLPRLGGLLILAALLALNAPLSFGFIGEDALLGALFDAHPAYAGLAIAAFALLTVGLIRLYFQLFAGRQTVPLPRSFDVGGLEAWGLGALAGSALFFGLWPAGLIALLG